ncbi:hypothetical protein Hanom_Chr10g00928291 [Helianthus anomalus]
MLFYQPLSGSPFERLHRSLCKSLCRFCIGFSCLSLPCRFFCFCHGGFRLCHRLSSSGSRLLWSHTPHLLQF